MFIISKKLYISTLLFGFLVISTVPTKALGSSVLSEEAALATQQDFVPMKDIQAFQKGIEQMAASTTSIKANFKQEKYLSILSNKIDSEGVILFKMPNLLRWEYQSPFEYIIVLNGNEIVIKDQGKVNAFDIGGSQAFKEVNNLIINSVQGNVLDEEQFHIAYYESETMYLAKLTPKDEQMKQFLQGIDIHFDRKDFSVSKVKLIESEGDYTLITFSNKKMNENIPDASFSVH
jgi:outer membrane lipoprotein-sorting protein